MKKDELTNIILWALVVLFVVTSLLAAAFQQLVPIWVGPLLLLPFVIVHGAERYKGKGILVFAIITLFVSYTFEFMSIVTGFPFGHYHYTDALGPILFLVPPLIGLIYITFGYISWTLASIFVGDVRHGSDRLPSFITPVIASFIMVALDLALDPTASTVRHLWIWEDGGGYFGVPLSNYLGWFLTTYVFFQLFALYLRQLKNDCDGSLTFSKSYYLQPVVIYATIVPSVILRYLVSINTQVTDAVGHVWQTGDIYETATIVSITIILFISVLVALKIVQDHGHMDRERT